MARTSVWRSALAAGLVGLASGCTERLNSPGECPALCPGEEIEVRDTILTGIVASDSSFRGFVAPFVTELLLLSNDPADRVMAAVRFSARFDTIVTATERLPIGSVDSVALEFRITRRDTLATNLRLVVFRLPKDMDSSLAFSAVLPHLVDSLLVDTIPIADAVRSDTSLVVSVPPGSVQAFAGDSGIVALGLALLADQPTTLTLAASNQTGFPMRMRSVVRAAAPNDTLLDTLEVAPTFDTFVRENPPVSPGGAALLIGNLPSARSLVRFDLPRWLVDSTTIIRGTLLLTPLAPARGRSGENFALQAVPVLRDFGGKSVLIIDDATTGFGLVDAGSSDTIGVEMGGILRFWRQQPDSLPRAVMLRNATETASLGEVEVGRGSGGASAPRLRVTYIRPYRFGVP